MYFFFRGTVQYSPFIGFLSFFVHHLRVDPYIKSPHLPPTTICSHEGDWTLSDIL